ncbi:MAG: sulfatase [Phycisphaerae bacterium]|nr:sulfatase [Tepidisphaeraceae bacterium]
MRLIALVLLLTAVARPAAADAPPNILLIISDDHAWTDYSFMGHKTVQTPAIDKLASQSLAFPRGYVPSSLCCPSLASIVTGLYPHQHKVTSNDPPKPANVKPADFQKSDAFKAGREVMAKHLEAVPTLPRVLKEKGYLSLQTGKWWQGHYSRGGFTHGMTQGKRHGDEGLDIGRKTLDPIYAFTDDARKQGKPWLVWYAPLMPHDPHTPPAELLEKYKAKTESIHVARYYAMVEWFDQTVGALMAHLDKTGQADNTIVVYLADNGWVQSPDNPRYAPRSKQSQYDGGLRTPLLVRWPAKVKPRTSDRLATSLDIAPTLLAAAGLKATADMPGVNLLDDAAVNARTTIFGEVFTHNAVDLNVPASSLRFRWIIDGDLKLIVPHKANEPTGAVELYDVAKDPDERENQAANGAAAVGRLRGKLDEWWKP